ncbi:MAG: hypothetical protein AAFX80_00065 [Cyanobacteria bacterium J06639_18]
MSSNNTIHVKPDLRVLLKSMIYRSSAVIAAAAVLQAIGPLFTLPCIVGGMIVASED